MSLPTPNGFLNFTPLTARQAKEMQPVLAGFPFLVSDGFASRIDWSNQNDPLLLQVLPTPLELEQREGFHADPLDEKEYRAAPGVLKKYQGRVILQLTGACPIHCRYCFRRHIKQDTIPNTLAQWQAGLEMIRSDERIKEVIYSGGDPLMVSDKKLFALSNALAEIPHLQRLRIHSRMPIADPKRITPALVEGLKKSRLVTTLVIHMNHPAEMDETVREALARLVDAGIPLYNQSVLLKGINDRLETLVELSEVLLQARVTPYYLHLLDRVAGAAHFQVDRDRGKALVAGLREHLPGYGVPLLVEERPGEGAKSVV
ncbi:MAG: EF-P beta-lysylation protein EpmB [Magnetococcales bacterium]|nr:EF-P beta-lysylation protein EpmB [Magnetococcales bacterium]